MEKGQTFRQAAKYASWYWRRRCYRSAPSKQIRASIPTLKREFYRWIKAGKSPDCFTLGYRTHPAIPADLVAKFCRACAVADSMVAAWKLVSEHHGVSFRAFCESLPGELRERIRAKMAERRKLGREHQAEDKRHQVWKREILNRARQLSAEIEALGRGAL